MSFNTHQPCSNAQRVSFASLPHYILLYLNRVLPIVVCGWQLCECLLIVLPLSGCMSFLANMPRNDLVPDTWTYNLRTLTTLPATYKNCKHPVRGTPGVGRTPRKAVSCIAAWVLNVQAHAVYVKQPGATKLQSSSKPVKA